MLERRHLALIHLAKKDLCLDDDTYRDILQVQAGVSSSKDLDVAGFEKLMTYFGKLGFVSKRAPAMRPPADESDIDVLDFISEGQQRYLAYLLRKVGLDDVRRQVGFCERQLKKRWPQTKTEANALIEALKKMVRRGYVAPPAEAPEAEPGKAP